MECIGKNKDGSLKVCACIMRQIKGCNDDKMKSGKNVRLNFSDIISRIDWSKTTTCYSETGNKYNEPRVCLCLNGQNTESCDPYMKLVPLSRDQVLQKIEGMIC